uniref:Uncharacterized protein n=1 Tax=Romanomermis culicivorax TaxID=13658 RepID=A0A915JZH6_ROMCU
MHLKLEALYFCRPSFLRHDVDVINALPADPILFPKPLTLAKYHLLAEKRDRSKNKSVFFERTECCGNLLPLLESSHENLSVVNTAFFSRAKQIPTDCILDAPTTFHGGAVVTKKDVNYFSITN